MTSPAPTLSTTSATGPVTAAPVTAAGRLPNGELRRRIARYLADHMGREFTPGQIARCLHRSSGAVGNALVTLVARGEAEQTGIDPCRYRGIIATCAAAAATTTPAGVTAGAATPAATPSPTRAGETAVSVASSGPGEPASGPAGGSSIGPSAPEVVGPVPRPNGALYHPRLLSGMADVTALRKLRAAGVPALLYGPPGTGKTSVIEAAFPDLVTVAGDVDTVVADLVGDYVATPEGGFRFVHGPLVAAMREGRCLFLDDATLISPSVLAVLYPAMDGRGEIVIKANAGETITAAPGFYVVAGHNPGVHGAVLSDALSSRFCAHIQVSTDLDLATQLNIDPRAVRVARNLATRQEKGEVGWAPQLRELIAFDRIAAVLGPEAAAGNLIGIAPEEDRDTVHTLVRNAFGKPLTPLSLGTRI